VVINLLDYEYTFGNDAFGSLFVAFFDKRRNSLPPRAVVAQGETRAARLSLKGFHGIDSRL
jgi:hypothetical protein